MFWCRSCAMSDSNSVASGIPTIPSVITTIPAQQEHLTVQTRVSVLHMHTRTCTHAHKHAPCRQIDRQTDRQTDKQIQTHTHTHTHTNSIKARTICIWRNQLVHTCTKPQLQYWWRHVSCVERTIQSRLKGGASDFRSKTCSLGVVFQFCQSMTTPPPPHNSALGVSRCQDGACAGACISPPAELFSGSSCNPRMP